MASNGPSFADDGSRHECGIVVAPRAVHGGRSRLSWFPGNLLHYRLKSNAHAGPWAWHAEPSPLPLPKREGHFLAPHASAHNECSVGADRKACAAKRPLFLTAGDLCGRL